MALLEHGNIDRGTHRIRDSGRVSNPMNMHTLSNDCPVPDLRASATPGAVAKPIPRCRWQIFRKRGRQGGRPDLAMGSDPTQSP